MDKKHRYIAYSFILLQCLLYGFGDPISKAAYETVSVYSLLTVRYTIAFLFMCLISGKTVVRDLKTVRVRDWLTPSLCIAAAYIVGNIALDLTAATSVAFLRSLSTMMTPILAFIFMRRRYDRKHIPFQLLIIVGLYLMCGYGGLGGFGMGEVFSLISAALLAGALIFGERGVTKMSAMSLTCLQSGMSALMALICAVVFEHGISMENIDLKIWLIIIYLAILCTVAGYFLQNKAMETISASDAALWQCLGPVMTAAFSFVVLGEKLSFIGIIGAAILMLCTALDTRLQK